MGEVIRFPVERRKRQIVQERALPNSGLKLQGARIESVADGVYVWTPSWFGVRLRPDRLTPA